MPPGTVYMDSAVHRTRLNHGLRVAMEGVAAAHPVRQHDRSAGRRQ
jgi:hypothetical protein